MNVVSDPDTVKYFKEKHASCEIRYGDMKKQLAEDIIKFTDPIRIRINDILADNKYLARVVQRERKRPGQALQKLSEK